MRLQAKKRGRFTYLYVIKSFRDNGKSTSKVVEKLGTAEELREKLNGADPIEWATAYIAELTLREKEEQRKVVLELSPEKEIERDSQRMYNGGYLFLQQIYNELGLDKICNSISKKYKFKYDLNGILSRLIYSRIMFPCSKLSTNEVSKKFIEPPTFDLQHIYRALSIVAKESDFIQSKVFKNSLKKIGRNTGVVYYDCTNFFFEIDDADNLRQYGVSKEHRPNPIVQMGLFMDKDGLPLSFCINPGNTNEQRTLCPLEDKLQEQFGLTKLVVCTDGGLSSYDNRKYNNQSNRAFISVVSLKKQKEFIKAWATADDGWRLPCSDQEYRISEIDSSSRHTFYKERWIVENGLSERLIITYSEKYRQYTKGRRANHIERAQTAIRTGSAKTSNKNVNDYKRFIEISHCTADGEVATKKTCSISDERIIQEEQYDGFYAVCTNLEDDISEIIAVNKWRWKIEESFRILKTEFKSRPVFLQRDDRITAHFLTCFLSLLVYRILEKKISKSYSCDKLVETLSEMNFLKIKGEGFMPAYNRSQLTDFLHDIAGFNTDRQIITKQKMKKIIKMTK